MPLPARRALAALALALLAGCAAPQTQGIIDDPVALPRRADIASVPFFAQEKYYCGPAALAMALAWSGLDVTQADLVPQVYTPGRDGSLANDMIAAARRNGRLAVPIDRLSDLLAELAAGHPVVVFQNLGLEMVPRWHFAVAVGYDLDSRAIRLHSGSRPDRAVALDTFEHTWRRAGFWALAVLPPGTLPATAGETAVLRAASGLERAGRPVAASRAYAAIARRWPESLAALVGLGNARYAAGDLAGAARAFRRAASRHPGAAPAWNNLAHVLGRLGRRDEAVAAARRAIRMAKGDTGRYRETLIEVSGAPG